MAVRTPASPKLKAITNSSPKPIRCKAMALNITIKAEGQGIRPPEMPNASKLRQVTVDPSAPGGK